MRSRDSDIEIEKERVSEPFDIASSLSELLKTASSLGELLKTASELLTTVSSLSELLKTASSRVKPSRLRLGVSCNVTPM